MYNLYVYIDPDGLDDKLFCTVSEEVRNKFMKGIIRKYPFASKEELCMFLSSIKDYIHNSITIDCERTSLRSDVYYDNENDVYILYFDIDWHDYYETEEIEPDIVSRVKNFYYNGGEENEKRTENIFTIRAQSI